jgi:CSLREA domain-containing protein
MTGLTSRPIIERSNEAKSARMAFIGQVPPECRRRREPGSQAYAVAAGIGCNWDMGGLLVRDLPLESPVVVARAKRFRSAMRVLLASALLLVAPLVNASDLYVNSPADVGDANPGDGVCETVHGNGVCTLRAAIQEANALCCSTIHLQAGVTYLLTSVDGSALFDRIVESMYIVGAGPASTIIDGNGAVLGKGVFDIAECPGGGNACDLQPGDPKVHVNISGVTIQHGGGNVAVIYNSGILNLTNTVITANSGGGIFSTSMGELTLVGSVVSNNTATSIGGGISAYDLTIIDSTISGNTTGGDGGGIYGAISVTITNSTISDNTAGGKGGGLMLTNGSTAIIRGSTFSNNTGTQGGGIYAASTLNAINSTISGNSASASGGGLHFVGSTAGLFNVTIAENLSNTGRGAAVGGGVAQEAGTINLVNSIVALNDIVIPTVPPITSHDDCSGTITSQGNNIMLVVNAAHCTVTGGGFSAVDPMLGPLQDNGGLTQTHALSIGSLAIDAGNSGGCADNLGAPLTTDQRGLPRPFGAHCDIGAYELSDTIFLGTFEL